MNEVSTSAVSEVFDFNFEGYEVRSLMIDGEPWFVGKDVASALGYKDHNSALRNVDSEDKKMGGSFSYPSLKDRFGRKINPTIINESGLYSLIFNSKLDSAKRFKHWVTSTVLPSIRKNGGYIAGQEHMSEDEIMARASIMANHKIEFLESKNHELLDNNLKQTSLTELLSGNKDRYTVTEIAKCYGTHARGFNQLLRNLKIQKKIGGLWVLTKPYENTNFMVGSTKNIYENKKVIEQKPFNTWTKDGVIFIYNTLRSQGICPIVEQNALEVINE